jgi:hypothetical protein
MRITNIIKMFSELDKLFMECVHTRDFDGVMMYISNTSTKMLKNMRVFANRKDYSEIVEVIDNEINSRG